MINNEILAIKDRFVETLHPEKIILFGSYVRGTLLAGELPLKQLKAVQNWLKTNEEKAYAAWNLAVQNKHFGKIDS